MAFKAVAWSHLFNKDFCILPIFFRCNISSLFDRVLTNGTAPGVTKMIRIQFESNLQGVISSSPEKRKILSELEDSYGAGC